MESEGGEGGAVMTTLGREEFRGVRFSRREQVLGLDGIDDDEASVLEFERPDKFMAGLAEEARARGSVKADENLERVTLLSASASPGSVHVRSKTLLIPRSIAAICPCWKGPIEA